MKKMLTLATLILAASTMASNSQLDQKANNQKNDENLREALLNLQPTKNINKNLGQKSNNDLIEDLSARNVNNTIINLKTTK